jgi:predicted aspartyl protease
MKYWIVALAALSACRHASTGVEVPIELAGPGRAVILLTAHVNGKGPFVFTLDTGATMTLVSPEVAQMAGLEVIGKGEATGAGGKIVVSLSRAADVTVGTAEVQDLPVGIIDVAPLGGAMGTKIDGILGHNFLQMFRVTIDYRNEKLHFE